MNLKKIVTLFSKAHPQGNFKVCGNGHLPSRDQLSDAQTHPTEFYEAHVVGAALQTRALVLLKRLRRNLVGKLPKYFAPIRMWFSPFLYHPWNILKKSCHCWKWKYIFIYTNCKFSRLLCFDKKSFVDVGREVGVIQSVKVSDVRVYHIVNYNNWWLSRNLFSDGCFQYFLR